jgi:hypothetical protein
LRRHPHERHSAFPYADLWEERQILSVANLTREDGVSFFAVAEQAGIRSVTELPAGAGQRGFGPAAFGRAAGRGGAAARGKRVDLVIAGWRGRNARSG